MAGLDSYQNATKETWRGWAWNQIVERLAPGKHLSWKAKCRSMQDKTILYLCGPDDVDREMGLKRGFQNHNLIACDIDKDCIVTVRKNGGIGVSSSLSDVLWMWPMDWRIDAVLADFTCGANYQTIMTFGRSLIHSSGVNGGCVAVVNLLRGRESQINEIREFITGFIPPPDWPKIADLSIHRGAMWIVYYYSLVAEGLMDSYRAIKNLSPQYPFNIEQRTRFYDLAFNRFLVASDPKFYSYPSRKNSATQWFDSVAVPLATMKVHEAHDRRDRELCEWWDSVRGESSICKVKSKFDRQSLIATLAALKASRNRLQTA